MKSKRWRLRIEIGVLGLLLFVFAAFNYVRVYCCAPVQLKFSGGNVCPQRSEMARKICGDVRDAGIVLEPSPGANSESICDAVDRGELDLGLVLGGFPDGSRPNVRQVASLGVDPLHLLVRAELIKNSQPSLDVIRGRRVSLGERGTNGALLASSLLRLAGFKPSEPGRSGDFSAEFAREADLHLAVQALACASPADRAAFSAILPDAIFLVDTLPAPLVDELVTVAGYQLVPLPFATAMHLDTRRDRAHTGSRLESSRLEAVTIPACAYRIEPPVPATDCTTIGLRLLLVANKKTSNKTIIRLLTALEGGAAERYHINFDTAEESREFTIHPGAEAYTKGRRPLVVGELVGHAGDFLSVIGAASAGSLALWHFLRGLRAVHPDVHLRQIDRIERLLHGQEQDEGAPSLPRDFVDYLEKQLAAVKRLAIDDYAAGRLEGDEALVSILTLIADTRHLLMQRRKQIAMGDCGPANARLVVEGKMAA